MEKLKDSFEADEPGCYNLGMLVVWLCFQGIRRTANPSLFTSSAFCF